ncbi:pentatricopeptide repeat-containing protein At1g55890, mitochondrial-like [Dioscorea cayenensis subsp. rotundata]|uniref:Pentatricopeptide repeat-containing protein At1g55890, mitochondrial-like n=1 Tax=Dioscorea cayennensis subsp. rotundata TaxID=55577 RepID=A0AB40AGF2_DIOCR|nr:pentatricopeptide repeat-containing protein At1g55890, mitochondrial-like [Dioscorea cayenensis subsp. rotundata]
MRLLARLRRHHLSLPFSSSPNLNLNPKPNPKPPSESIRAIIKALNDESDLDKLVTSFKSAAAIPRFRAIHNVYEITVRRLAIAGRLASIEDILESQKTYSDISREGFGIRLISLYARAGMLSHAATTFDQLPSLGCPRTVASFNALLTACTHVKDIDRLAEVFRDVPASDPSIVPNAISYNILILALCEKGDPHAALDALKLMEKNEMEPNLITFNTLLNGFYSKSFFLDGEKVWEKMKDKNIDPDIRSYNAKLRGLVLQGRTMEAVELIGKLNDLGSKPDIFSFNAVIKGYLKDGKLEEAKKVYSELMKNDCAPNRWTFEMLIPELYEAGELDMALKLSYESLSRRCFVEVGVLQKVVDGLAKASRVGEAKKLVERGKFKSFARKGLKLPLSSLVG